MTDITQEPNREQVKELLRELHRNPNDEEAKRRVKYFFQNADAAMLGEIEQELIQQGVSREEIRSSLCDIHLEAMGDSLESGKVEPEPGHPIHTFMEEHKMIRQSLDDLMSIINKLDNFTSVRDMEGDFGTLEDATHHLVGAESHYQREEEALFPKLELHAVFEPPQIMREEHVDIRERKQQLNQPDLQDDLVHSRLR